MDEYRSKGAIPAVVLEDHGIGPIGLIRVVATCPKNTISLLRFPWTRVHHNGQTTCDVGPGITKDL